MTGGRRIAAPPEQLQRYERLVASVPEAELRSNFGSAYTAVNGNMYSMISKYGVVGIRLPEPDRSQFLTAYDTELFRADPSWPVSKEYVAVPADLLEDTATLTPYLRRSLAYAQGLRPKPTKRSGTGKPRPAAGGD